MPGGLNQCFFAQRNGSDEETSMPEVLKVVRLGNAVEETDAVNLKQVDDKVEQVKTEVTTTINGSLMVGRYQMVGIAERSRKVDDL